MEKMNRREFLRGTTAVAATLALGSESTIAETLKNMPAKAQEAFNAPDDLELPADDYDVYLGFSNKFNANVSPHCKITPEGFATEGDFKRFYFGFGNQNVSMSFFGKDIDPKKQTMSYNQFKDKLLELLSTIGVEGCVVIA